MKAEIEKWYADKISKTTGEFDAIDKHIATVVHTWENEREKVLSLLSNKESEEEKECEHPSERIKYSSFTTSDFCSKCGQSF